LRLSRNFEFDAAIQRRHLKLSTQRSIGKTNGYFTIQMPTVSLEQGVLAHLQSAQINRLMGRRQGLLHPRR
jgi:hypothetical protein